MARSKTQRIDGNRVWLLQKHEGPAGVASLLERDYGYPSGSSETPEETTHCGFIS